MLLAMPHYRGVITLAVFLTFVLLCTLILHKDVTFSCYMAVFVQIIGKMGAFTLLSTSSSFQADDTVLSLPILQHQTQRAAFRFFRSPLLSLVHHERSAVPVLCSVALCCARLHIR